MSLDDAAYAVTAEEDAEYEQFCTAAIRQLMRQPPKTLWYYTSATTFGLMLKSHQVWSTQISCLNDETEFRHAVDLVRKAIRP